MILCGEPVQLLDGHILKLQVLLSYQCFQLMKKFAAQAMLHKEFVYFLAFLYRFYNGAYAE